MRPSAHSLSLTLLSAAFLWLGCTDSKSSDQDPPPLKRSRLTVSPTAVDVTIGSTEQLIGLAWDSVGTPLPDPAFTWSSATPGVADVSKTGAVTAVAAGTAAITVSSGGYSATTRVTVASPPPLRSDITFTIDATSTFPISRYIYGGNFISQKWSGATLPKELTFNRMGGNRATAYNWETNYSNAGADYKYQNDQSASSSTVPGAAVVAEATPTFAAGQAFMWTIPMIGYVSGDACMCNVGITDSDRAARMAAHFKVSKSAKGSPFTRTPDQKDPFVYQDEFVNWFESKYPGRSTHPTAPVFFSLDNEPDIWHVTHREIQSDIGDNPKTPRLLTYTAFSDTTVAYAKAIKAVMPNALIFGPATATYTGITKLGRHPTPDPVYGSENFVDVYLDRLKAASAAASKRLLDVLDIHFYPQNGTSAGQIGNDYATQDEAMIQARVQAPRSLWDPTYNDGSWVTNVTNGPIRLIPRLRAQIVAHYPGTKLAITEYYYGRGGDISGGIAQADVLGIFGREGVFAAALFPNAGIWAPPYKGDGNKAFAFIFGAFRMFRNYDGSGAAFGDTGLKSNTSDDESSSVYASRDSLGRVVVVAINKTNEPKVARLTLNGVSGLSTGRVYRLTVDSSTPTRAAEDLSLSSNGTLYTMPAMSVSTIVFSK